MNDPANDKRNCEERRVRSRGNEEIRVFIVWLPLPFSPITLTVEDCTAGQLSEVYETITQTAFCPVFVFFILFLGDDLALKNDLSPT